jgi:cell fate (sporulation/competence/biofilm development) regulator YlbF (YheA/YmcA/DUF963 family)
VALAFLAVPVLAACGGEGEGGDAEQTAGSDATPGSQVQGSAAMQEYRQLAQELDSIRQQAMEDPDLQAEETRLREAIQAKMEEDPQTQALVARFDSTRQAFQEAQSSGDSAAMQELMPQLQQMQMQLQQAQGQVTEDPEIAEQIEDFREELQAEMESIDPDAPEMMERADSLVEQIRQDMSSGAEGAPGAGAADTGSGGR